VADVSGPTEQQLAELQKQGMRVICSQNAVGLQTDPDLTRMVSAWPTLLGRIKSAELAILDAACSSQENWNARAGRPASALGPTSPRTGVVAVFSELDLCEVLTFATPFGQTIAQAEMYGLQWPTPCV
jgi:hypothetical protein